MVKKGSLLFHIICVYCTCIMPVRAHCGKIKIFYSILFYSILFYSSIYLSYGMIRSTNVKERSDAFALQCDLTK